MQEPISDEEPLGSGFADAVQQSQQIFRQVLDAMARPGTKQEIPAMPYAPAPLNAASTAIVLTLLDESTPVWLDEAADNDTVRTFIAFHCGCPIVADPGEASFALIAGALPSLDRFNQGNDEFPEDSSTLIVQVETVSAGTDLFLAGPGIEDENGISDPGLPDSFWEEWAEMDTLLPCGVDLVLTADHSLTCLPRSVRRVERA
ncbi:MAG: phosphonate C-P lyase system protein PhnH [Pseudomonadota bacterium]